MGDAGGVGQSWASAARLVRCTGFGASGAEVDAAARRTRSEYAAALFTDHADDPGVAATPVPRFDPLPVTGPHPTAAEVQRRTDVRSDQQRTLLRWWLGRMLAVERPFTERLTLAWHGIFATALEKVLLAPSMLQQYATLRAKGAGDFRSLALAMLTDVAMIVWLDNQTNTRAAPNENLAREFMELFALGHGNGYTETDVREGARALSGWTVDLVADTSSLDPSRHDDGVKTVLGVTGRLDHVGFADAVLAQRASAPFVLGRLWNQLVSDTAMDSATRTAAVAAYRSGRDVAAGVTAMLTSRGFDQAGGTRVVAPVEWTIGLARAVGAPGGDATEKVLAASVKALGQVPFHPPSVGGWPSGQAWLSSATVDARWNYAHVIVALGDVDAVASASAANRLDAAGHLLGIAAWSDRSASALKPFVSRPVDLVAAATMTPEYLTV